MLAAPVTSGRGAAIPSRPKPSCSVVIALPSVAAARGAELALQDDLTPAALAALDLPRPLFDAIVELPLAYPDGDRAS